MSNEAARMRESYKEKVRRYYKGSPYSKDTIEREAESSAQHRMRFLIKDLTKEIENEGS